MHRCPNRACPSRGLETLINWVSAAMDIEGVGEQFVRRLWELGPAALDARLSTGSRSSSCSSWTASRSARRRTSLSSIEASKGQPFSRVLFGLNIPDVGWVTAQNLARHFGSVDRLLDASQEEIQEVDGIGPDRAESIAEWFSDEQNRTLVAGAARARAHVRGRRGREAGRGAAHGRPVRAHRHAGGLHARGGGRGAGLARREGVGQRLQEDDRRDRGREPRRRRRRRRRRRECRSSPRPSCASSSRTRRRARRPGSRRRRAAASGIAAQPALRARSRSGPGRGGPSTARPAAPFWMIAKT